MVLSNTALCSGYVYKPGDTFHTSRTYLRLHVVALLVVHTFAMIDILNYRSLATPVFAM